MLHFSSSFRTKQGGVMGKRLSFTALAACALVMIAGSAMAKQVIKVATYYPESHPTQKSLEYLKENLAKDSNGEIVLQIFPNNQLGNEEAFIDSVKRGIIQMAVSGGLVKKDEPMLALVEPPFVFETWKQAKAAYTGEIGVKITGDYTKNTGVKIVGYSVNGFREISSSVPIASMEDLKKVKLRVPTNEIYVKMFQAFGPATVMMPMGEIYNALETGVVDGQDNPYATVQATGWWEVQKYMLESRHMFVASPWLVNKKFYDQMPDNLQKIFDDNVKKAIEHNWKISEEFDASAKQFLKDKGLTITVPSDAFRQQMKDSLKDFYSWYFETIPGAKEIVPAMEQLPK